MKKRIYVGAAASTLIAVVALAAMVSGAIARTTATPLPASSCSAMQGSGQMLVASDLPLEGSGRTQTQQMTRAIKFIFQQHNWKAGKYSLAYQSCDDATAQAGKWDSGKCSANANAYAQDSSVVGVIGTFNSGCAEIIIPILNRAPNGPIAMVSPANTYVGLTHPGPGTSAGEPGKYYPTGKRNYARVVAADDYQGAADAILAYTYDHASKVFVLNDKEAYGLGVATNFKNAYGKLGGKVVGFTAWDGKASSYEALAVKIKASGAQAVFLGGLICENGGKLIKDIAAGAPGVKILAPDGFTPVSATIQEAGAAAANMTVSVAGLPNSELKGAGQAFVSAFTKADHHAPDPYSVYAAQAAEVIVQAIAQSNGTRADVAKQLFKLHLNGSILGNVSFNSNGDVTANPVTIYKVVGGKQTTYKVIVPPKTLVHAA